MNYKLFFKKVINRLKAEFWGRFHRLSFFLSKMVPDRIYLEHRYKRLMGKKLNLNPPITFNEKLIVNNVILWSWVNERFEWSW